MSSPNIQFQRDCLTTITDPDQLKQAVLTGLNSWVYTRGEIAFPCVPTLLDHYTERLKLLFVTLGKPFLPTELEQLRQVLAQKLAEGFATSPYAKVIFRYESAQPPGKGMTCQITTQIITIAERCDYLAEIYPASMFGTNPDAKVMAVAQTISHPENARILEIGAGTGRNAIPLARLGYPVDALDLSPAFVEQLQTVAKTENLPITVKIGDFFAPEVMLRPTYYQLAILASVVPHFREVSQVRLLMAKISDLLCPGGILLFNAFLTQAEYQPDQTARELAYTIDSFFLTRNELAMAMAKLPLQLISDESMWEYEEKHLPIGSWPPSAPIGEWATGKRLFPLENGKTPIELRWIVCQRL